MVKESVEPLLDDYRPPGIKSLKFSKFSLGTVSPKIEGFLLYVSHSILWISCLFLWCIPFLTIEGFPRATILFPAFQSKTNSLQSCYEGNSQFYGDNRSNIYLNNLMVSMHMLKWWINSEWWITCLQIFRNQGNIFFIIDSTSYGKLIGWNSPNLIKNIAKELMAQWQSPLAGWLLPRVRSSNPLGTASKTSVVSLGVFLSKIKIILFPREKQWQIHAI